MALALLTGLGVTALLFAGASRLENDKVALAFEQRANARLFLLQQGVANTVGSLASVNQLFASRAAVSRAEFHLFTKPLLERHPYVQAISYLRVLPHEGRAAYEAALAQLRPGAVITEMRDGKPAPAGVRPQYRVVDYIEPQEANSEALGLDTAYPALDADARRIAYETGKPVAGPLVPLAQQAGLPPDLSPMSRLGVVISMPVYRYGAPQGSAAERLAALQGETAAVLQPSGMIARLLADHGLDGADGLALRVYAASSEAAASLVYQSSPARAGNRAVLPPWLAWLYPQHPQPFAQRFDVAGKTWLMTAAAPTAVYAGDHLASLFTLVLGALLTALGAAWVHALASRSHEVRRLVEERTAELRHQAMHDALTGLPNRALLADRLLQTIHHSERKGHALWLVSIDLDRFKFTNSRLGHKGGDRLLQAVAERLQLGVRPVDTVARMGGDEFALMLLPEQGASSPRADQLQRALDCLSVPLYIDGQELFLACSAGIAVYPDDGDAPGVLMERADIAMFRAKEMGGDKVQFYTAAMNERLGERMLIEGALRVALERNELVLHYQPQTDIAAGRVVGMEALIRWQHPELGMVAPNRFIPLAEETGLILPIGAWVLRTACEQMVAWRSAGRHGLRMAVNVSARQMAERDFVQSVAQVLADTGLPPSCLELELTESQVMSDVEHAIAVMHQLKKLGVLLAIDDFGTGYSSLAHLKRFEVDVLKIDQTFVRDLTVDPDDAAIVTTIIALATNLGLEVISEGVETSEQLEFLRQHGCRQMQGYYFSRPAPAAAIEAILQDDAARAAAA
jgi:diguanylate cyclase (GGDEF)-like protein